MNRFLAWYQRERWLGEWLVLRLGFGSITRGQHLREMRYHWHWHGNRSWRALRRAA